MNIAPTLLTLPLALAAAATIGCQSTSPAESAQAMADTSGSSISPIQTPRGMPADDTARLQLSRLVGVWSVKGWSTMSGLRKDITGRAAATTDHDWFVRMDLNLASQTQTTLRGETGSMLFASEPGQGITLSAWFETEPAIARFIGAASTDGSVFVLDEFETVGDHNRIRMTMHFQDNNSMRMEFLNLSQQNTPTVGSFTFTRN